jgi:hypothetical protein
MIEKIEKLERETETLTYKMASPPFPQIRGGWRIGLGGGGRVLVGGDEGSERRVTAMAKSRAVRTVVGDVGRRISVTSDSHTLCQG